MGLILAGQGRFNLDAKTSTVCDHQRNGVEHDDVDTRLSRLR